MPGLSRNAAFTSQMLGFARAQLGFLKPDLNVYEQRVLKHAFISQAVNAFLAYLEEIELLTSRDLPLVNLTAFLRSRFQKPGNNRDFRFEEIQRLLFAENDKAWLLNLLSLYEQSQHTTVVERKTPKEDVDNAAKDKLIIAVAEEKRLPLWWDYDKNTLTEWLTQLETLISRQREIAAES